MSLTEAEAQSFEMRMRYLKAYVAVPNRLLNALRVSALPIGSLLTLLIPQAPVIPQVARRDLEMKRGTGLWRVQLSQGQIVSTRTPL